MTQYKIKELWTNKQLDDEAPDQLMSRIIVTVQIRLVLSRCLHVLVRFSNGMMLEGRCACAY